MSEGSLTSVETRQYLSRLIPPEIADILGHPPVLSTENRQAYDALMTQLVLEWKPRNIISWATLLTFLGRFSGTGGRSRICSRSHSKRR